MIKKETQRTYVAHITGRKWFVVGQLVVAELKAASLPEAHIKVMLALRSGETPIKYKNVVNIEIHEKGYDAV